MALTDTVQVERTFENFWKNKPELGNKMMASWKKQRLWAWQTPCGLLLEAKLFNSDGVLEHWHQQVAIINNPDRNECANNGASAGYLHLFRMARITSFVCSVVFPGWIPDKAEHTFSKSKKAYLRTGH